MATKSTAETPGMANRVQDASAVSGNDPTRAAWFRDQALGLFIHWSMDAQLGSVISHSMVGASDDYLQRFIHELPKTFNPTRFDPDDLNFSFFFRPFFAICPFFLPSFLPSLPPFFLSCSLSLHSLYPSMLR